jgi:hypothetical protein
MRPRPEIFDETVNGEEQHGFNGTLVEANEDDSGVLNTVADVFAFPFRGVGWLLEQVF